VRRLALILVAACGGGSGKPVDAGAVDAKAIDATPDADVKAAPCAASFGSDLTAGFGRMDGTIVAVVPPGDEACAEPNSTHLVVQVMKASGVFRMVVDVLSNQGSPDVLYTELDAPLAGDAWDDGSGGWHTGSGAALDYVTTLGVHSTAFAAMQEDDLVHTITDKLELGAKISIYATNGSTEPDSAHLVHRNLTGQDGAIVLAPDTAPHYLLMRFDEQSF
jgi:hypothetical protein